MSFHSLIPADTALFVLSALSVISDKELICKPTAAPPTHSDAFALSYNPRRPDDEPFSKYGSLNESHPQSFQFHGREHFEHRAAAQCDYPSLFRPLTPTTHNSKSVPERRGNNNNSKARREIKQKVCFPLKLIYLSIRPLVIDARTTVTLYWTVLDWAE